MLEEELKVSINLPDYNGRHIILYHKTQDGSGKLQEKKIDMKIVTTIKRKIRSRSDTKKRDRSAVCEQNIYIR